MPSPSDYVVISHTLDEAAGVYRVEVGIPVTNPDVDSETGEPTGTETVTGYVDRHDVMFSADDERWFAAGRRRRREHVAAEQRDEVTAALRRRLREAEAEPESSAEAVDLPGTGEALG